MVVLGRDARLIRPVAGEHAALVLMKTEVGSARIVDVMIAEQFPRIC